MSTYVHPVMADMLKLGCKSPSAASLAFQVYMELSEVRQCWDVQYSFNSQLGLIYFKTLDHKSQEVPEIIIPMSTFNDISPSWLDQLNNEFTGDFEEKVITLALKDSDSTVLFYKLYNGLKEPMSLEESQVIKMAEEKKRLMETDLRKQQDKLYKKARDESL